MRCVGAYLLQIGVGGDSPVVASAVFQPVVVVESLAIAWSLFAIALWWSDRGTPGRRWIVEGADGSFGIFLVHPLVLQALLSVCGGIGLLGVVRRAPVGVELAALLLVAVPVIYLTSAGFAALARRTPFSLCLTGRPAATRPASPLNQPTVPPQTSDPRTRSRAKEAVDA